MFHDMQDDFEGQIERLKSIGNARTQNEIAEMLGISQPSVAAVFKKRGLPARWLIIMAKKYHINPIWILSATQPVFITAPQKVELFSGASDDTAHLENVSLEALIDEIQRRLDAAQ